MKCQRCDKTATYHITELSGGKPQEVHLCEDCARDYLTQTDSDQGELPSLANMLKTQLSVEQTAEELAKLDKRACPICGITFYEFRNQGRLGCPHDYVFFGKEMEPLLMNIHGETQHLGKAPKFSPTDTDKRTELIRMRREMKEAVQAEDYERASKIRDDIKNIEGQRNKA